MEAFTLVEITCTDGREARIDATYDVGRSTPELSLRVKDDGRWVDKPCGYRPAFLPLCEQLAHARDAVPIEEPTVLAEGEDLGGTRLRIVAVPDEEADEVRYVPEALCHVDALGEVSWEDVPLRSLQDLFFRLAAGALYCLTHEEASDAG